MNLPRFLVGVADVHLARFWMRLFRVEPSRSWPMRTWLAVALHVPVLGMLAGALLMVLQTGTPMRGSTWPLTWGLGIGLVVGVFDTLLLGVAWNRRASRLRHAGRTALELPPRRVWETWLVAPVYFVGILVLTPLALWFAQDNARGTREWRREHAALVARGEPLTIEQLLGPPPPEADNLATTPLLRPLLDYRLVVSNRATEVVWNEPGARYRLEAIGLPEAIPAADAPRRGSKTPTPNDPRLRLDDYARGIRAMPVRRIQHAIAPELAARYGVATSGVPVLDREKAASLVITNAARDVLDYLSRFEPEFNELAQAATRPRCRFPVHWDELYAGQWSHLAAGKRVSQLFRVRAAARLSAGDPTGALADTRTLVRLSRMFSEEPLLISQLVQIAQVTLAIQGVWEGLAAQAWTGEQVALLQTEMANIDLREDMVAGLRGERRTGNAMYDAMLGGVAPGVGSMSAPGDAEGSSVLGIPVFFPYLAPHGFLRRNQVHHNRLLDALIAEVRNPAWPASATPPKPEKARLRELGFTPMTPDVILPAMLLPALDKAHTKAARVNATARLAMTACALERFRLAHGRFPEALEELTPGLLATVPLDPMDNQPLRYHTTPDSWYRLWSVGLNGRDDGGRMKRPAENDQSGDWVWPVPVPSTEPTLFGGG